MLKSGKLANVIKEMRPAKLDVLGLTEVRWKDGGDFVSDGVRVIYAGGDDSQRGVAVLLDGTADKCVTSVERHSNRLLVVNLHASPRDICSHTGVQNCTCLLLLTQMKRLTFCMNRWKQFYRK